MSRTYEKAEELFRFASMRAPAGAQLSASLLQLADQSDVPEWLASASKQDFAQELEALEARWHGLTGNELKTAPENLRLGSESSPASTDDNLPVVKGKKAQLEADALLKSLWKFYLQGISSGAAQPHQLQRAHQLMAHVTLLQALSSGNKGAAAAARAQAAGRPAIRLPAAFEAHLRARRAESCNTPAAVDSTDSTATRAQLEERVLLLQALEARLAQALAHAPAFEAPLPFSAPIPAPADRDAPRTYYFQPAADPAQIFRVANESLLLEIDEADIATAGLTGWQVLDALRRGLAEVLVQIAVLPADTPVPTIPAGANFGIRPVGVADLRVIRQVLIGYEKGELAEIHSVVQGATVERQQSRLQRADVGASEWAQFSNEKWVESMKFDRGDMGRFMYATARENQDQNASVNLSGAYGEVQVNSSAFGGFNRGRDAQLSEDMRRSRELIERALQLTRLSVSQSRWHFLTAELQDSIVYKLKAKCGNIVSQYRWVDQVYEAQMFNCGARAMYEVMVPRPAALFTELLARQPHSTPFAGPPPVRPLLKVSDITESSWAMYARRFGVTLTAPPPVSITEYAQVSNQINIQIAPGIDLPGQQASSGVFNRGSAIEQGYQASIAGVSLSWIGVAGQSGITASVGALLFSSSPDAGEPIPAQALGGVSGDISFSASAWGTVDQFTANFYVVWTRTQRALEQWQLASYQIIMDDYQSKLAAYLEKAALPLTEVQMRTIERTELKRAVLEIIRRGSGLSAPAPDAIAAGLPAIDVARLEAAAREVRFFEYAFEWDQMTYRFYPYFWAGRESWSAGKFTQQGDALFTAFLNAGFASVILPVRKGFEDAAAVYLSTGVVLDLEVVPANDELAAMNCEIAQINSACDDAVPEGDPWTYRVPTSMMVLDEEISSILPSIAG